MERVKLFLFENEIICTSECVCVLSHSVVSDSLWPSWTVARQAPLSLGIFQARILEWVVMPSSGGSSLLRDQTQVSHTYIGKRIFKKKLPKIIIEFMRLLDRWSTYKGILYFYILATNSWELNLSKIPFKIVSKSITYIEINLEYMSRPVHWKLKTLLRDIFKKGWGTHVYLWRIHFDIWQI